MSCILVITGSRRASNDNRKLIGEAILAADPLVVLQGGAAGADSIARSFCWDRAITTVTVPADWEGQGVSAGYERNERMLAMAQDLEALYKLPVLVLAFPTSLTCSVPSKGTRHCIREAEALGLEVRIQEIEVEERQIWEWKSTS